MLENNKDRRLAGGTIGSSTPVYRDFAELAVPFSPEHASNCLDNLLKERALASMASSQLMDALGISPPATAPSRAATRDQIGALLDKIGIGFEPDARYGPRGLSHDCDVILFKSADGAPVNCARPTYRAALTMIEVAALAAAADGNIVHEEVEFIIAELKAALELSNCERVRLFAFAWVTLRNLPWQQEVMDRLAKLPEQDRRRVAQSAMSAVLADGRILSAEVRFVENLYKVLGYPTQEIEIGLHRNTVAADTPVVVAIEQHVAGTPIPPSLQPEWTGHAINRARVERIKRETAAVSALLAGIFADDMPTSAIVVREPGSNYVTHGFEGLDEAHGQLLAAVISVRVISRADFEGRARSLRLLPDGALETINQWGFDTFEEAVLEGDELIAVADHLRAKLEKFEFIS
jgi:hypothetical protein